MARGDRERLATVDDDGAEPCRAHFNHTYDNHPYLHHADEHHAHKHHAVPAGALLSDAARVTAQ
jgi:hypothetical protein